MKLALPPQAPSTEGIADLGDAKLHYWDTGGSGPAIILLHPGSGSTEFYPWQQPVFAAAGYRVICYARRGHFGSMQGTNDDSAFAIDDLLALTRHLGVSRFHLVGNALGGFIAIDLALSCPDLPLSLVLACSMMGISEPDFASRLRALRPAAFDSLPAEFKELGPSYRAIDPEGVAEWKARHARAGKGSRVRIRNNIDWAALAGLRMPILLITGDADLWMPPALLREAGARIPNSRVEIVADCGHAIQWEQPAAFNRLVLDFISDLTRA